MQGNDIGRLCTVFLPCIYRVGKILWENIPEHLNSSWGIETFADLCHSDTRHYRIFTPEYVVCMYNNKHMNGSQFSAVLKKRALVNLSNHRLNWVFWRHLILSSLIPEQGRKEWL